tara:strand:+ start:230 stop:430 length:201 start_codon:yes stop_codon:yes gene_type:complete
MRADGAKTPEEMFKHELSSVFVRWWSESDLDDDTMASIASDVIEELCHTSVDFEADFDPEKEDEED